MERLLLLRFLPYWYPACLSEIPSLLVPPEEVYLFFKQTVKIKKNKKIWINEIKGKGKDKGKRERVKGKRGDFMLVIAISYLFPSRLLNGRNLVFLPWRTDSPPGEELLNTDRNAPTL
jgi:hypothetical protein